MLINLKPLGHPYICLLYTSIREALAKLESDLLIGDSPAGTIVLGITENDVKDMFVVKRKLEVIATTMAAKHISEDGIAKLKDILEQQEFYASKDNADKVRDLSLIHIC